MSSNSFIQSSIYDSQIIKVHEPSQKQRPFQVLKQGSIKMIESNKQPMLQSNKQSVIQPNKQPINSSQQMIIQSNKQIQFSKQSPGLQTIKPTYKISPVKPEVIQYLKPQQMKSVKQQISSNKPDQKTFLKCYEENMLLKSKQIELLKEIKQLKEKVNRKDQYKRMAIQNQINQLAQGKKAEWDNRKQPTNKIGHARGFSANKNVKTGKVQHLLQIIDNYKEKLILANEEIANLNKQKFLLEQDMKMKDRKYQGMEDDKPNYKQELNLSEQLKRSIREAELQKQRNKFLQLNIRSLQTKITMLEHKVEDLDNLKIEKRSLQQKVIRMTQLPNFNSVIDKAQQQRKGKQLQSKFKLLNQKYNSLKDTSVKQEAQIRLLENKIVQITHDTNSLQIDNQTLREQSISNPVLLKLNKNPQLLQKILIQIQRQKRDNAQPVENSKIKIQKLILEKEQLARQALNAQAKLQMLQKSFKQRQKILLLQKQQTAAAINQPRNVSKQGVIYEGDVGVFTEQPGGVPAGSNYFDLFLGEVNLLQAMVHSITGLSNSSNPLVLATVDFYNHNTEHSKLTQGCRCDLQSQFAFRVTEDDFFLKYLQKGTFQIDVWASQGNKNYHLGKANIELKLLVSRSRPKIAPVVSTSVPLYFNQKVMGSINLIMRIRLPIFDQLQRLLEGGVTGIQNVQQFPLRRLVIQIDEGRGFGQKSNCFVYFPFRLEDHYTRTAKGSNPIWNHLKLMQIVYDNDFKNYLRKGELEFTVFDDSVLAVDDKNSDVIGTAILSLQPLLEGKDIRERMQIKKGNQKKGTVDIKIYWHQVEDSKQKDAKKLQEEKMLSTTGLHAEIRQYMKDHSASQQKIFRLIDDNKTGAISYDQFTNWLKSIGKRKYSPEVLNSYYKGFKQPLNQMNFVIRMSRDVDIAIDSSQQKPIVEGIGMINQLLKINSNSIQKKKKTIEQFLVGKNVVQLAKQIETDNRGFITRAKLQDYFDKNGVEGEIESERVRLIDYLKKKQTLDLIM